MISLPPLAFVDLETTGLSPRTDRIAEIGVVTVDGAGVEEWTTLVHPGARISEHARLFNGIADDVVAAAPRFRDIAAGLHRRLAGRLLIAHNARFDFGFLRVEFERAGYEFQPQVLCSVMLSRRLYPGLERHDLDTLMQRHGLRAAVRHRALPDAQVLWQFWQVLRAEHPPERLIEIIERLLEGPVLPAHLDPSLIDRLPEAPGVYVMQGADDAVLKLGKAGNLKRHFLNYFRLDRASRKAAAVSHLVRNITWQTTQGAIGARLRLKTLAGALQNTAKIFYSWQLMPDAFPCMKLVCLSDRGEDRDDTYGLYDSARKARNALLQLSTAHNLCHALLGIRDQPAAVPCTGCALNGISACGARKAKLVHFTKIVAALAPLRIRKWPYGGPIGIKERSDLHILDDWRYVGTAQGEHEISEVLESRRDDFDEEIFAFLAKTLSRLPQKRIVRLHRPDAD